MNNESPNNAVPVGKTILFNSPFFSQFNSGSNNEYDRRVMTLDGLSKSRRAAAQAE